MYALGFCLWPGNNRVDNVTFSRKKQVNWLSGQSEWKLTVNVLVFSIQRSSNTVNLCSAVSGFSHCLKAEYYIHITVFALSSLFVNHHTTSVAIRERKAKLSPSYFLLFPCPTSVTSPSQPVKDFGLIPGITLALKSSSSCSHV